ncbi:MAG: hypothetical protein Fur006_15670 [Coleofasciculaceae cyanobacterium]|jgi:hypothetical protein
METFTAGAIATLVLTKAIEKAGETLGEKVMEKGGKLMQLLKRKSPDTASAIEVAAQHPELVEQQPEDYGEAVLVEKVESAANSDSEIAAAVQALADAVKSQVPATTIENWKGINIKGGSPTINNPNFTF